MKAKTQLDYMKQIRKPLPKPTISFGSRKRKLVDGEHRKQMRDY
jgi:hypothetical protein